MLQPGESPETLSIWTGEAWPEDLSLLAVKVARRLQSLRSGRIYAILLVKHNDEWVLNIDDQGDAERIRE